MRGIINLSCSCEGTFVYQYEYKKALCYGEEGLMKHL